MRSWRAMNAKRLCTRRRKSRSVPLLSSSGREMVIGTDCFESGGLAGSPCLAALVRSARSFSRDTNRLRFPARSWANARPLVRGRGEILHHGRTRDPRLAARRRRIAAAADEPGYAGADDRADRRDIAVFD